MWFSSRRNKSLEQTLAAIERLCTEILVIVTANKWKANHMINVLQLVAQQVERTVTLETSLVTLVRALGAQISQNASDATFIQTLGDHLQDLTNANDLAAAVLAGTPQDPNAAPPAATPATPAADPATPAAAPAADVPAVGNAPAPSEPSASPSSGSVSTETTTATAPATDSSAAGTTAPAADAPAADPAVAQATPAV